MGIKGLEEQNLHAKQQISLHSPILTLKAPSLVNTLLTSVKFKKPQEPSQSVFLKSGWLCHYSDKDPKVQRHFWKVDDEFITLHLTENGSLLYKKISVKDIVSLKELKVSKNGFVRHILKLCLTTEKLSVFSDNEDQTRNLMILRNWSNAIKCSQAKSEQKIAEVKKNAKKEKGVFEKCQFVLDFQNATHDTDKQLRQLITANGGQISYILTRNTNYLLLCQDETTKSYKTHKSQKAVALGIPIVTSDFVETCVKKSELVDHAEFVPNSSIGGDFSKGKISSPVTNVPKAKQKEKFDIEKIARYKIDSGDCPIFSKKFQVPKYAILARSSAKDHSIEAIFCVEVHIAVSYNQDNLSEIRVMVSGRDESGKSCYVYSVCDVTEAAKCYEFLVEKYIATGMKRIYGLNDEEICSVVSEPLALILSEIKTSFGIIHPQVIRLVERIWTDSLGELNNLLDIDPASVTLEKIRNALIALLKIESSLEKDLFKADLSHAFYKFLPHKPDHRELIDSIGKVAKKRELCQLLKDIASVNETSWMSKDASDVQSQYTALKCALIWLDPSGSEYKTVKDLLPEKTDPVKFHLKNIFRVNCNAESMEFKSKVGNTKLLFHSSDSQNFVGIFSRGLLLPHEVTKTLGASRRDMGNLGAGIYFTDSFRLSCEFTTPSKVSGSRLMLVNEVALGKVFETNETMPELTAPPESFNSVKWVKAGDKGVIKTQDSEYAVYDRDQQRMCYVLEFTLDDEVMTSHDSLPVTVPLKKSIRELDITDVSSQGQENLNPVLKEVTYGLVMESESPTPKLDEVHVRAKIIDLVSEVIIFQAYINESKKTVEAKYVFPLMKDAAVCGFEAYINEKHVVGIVKEKEQAHKEYKEAVSAGQGAYLMDEEKPNVFSVSIGNIPPNARVVIKITYVCELEIVDEPHSCVSFSLPGNISELDKQSALLNSNITQTTTDSFVVSKGDKSSLMLSVDMPYDIINITSPSHKILVKKTATKACVKLQKSANLGSESFNLFIQVAEIHVPRIWIEKLEPENDGQVAMVTFFPEFDFAASGDFDCTMLLDMSNSMGGLASHVRYLCSMLIDLLPSESHFQVIAFGSHSEESSVGFRKAGTDAKEKAREFISRCLPSLGGSDILYLLNSMSLMQDSKSYRLHNIFLFSDGRLAEQERLLKTASLISAKSKSFTRIFTCAIGDSPDSHTLQSLSLLTGGSYEHFSPSIKTSWGKHLQSQLVNSKQPVLTDVYIDWCGNDDAPKNNLQVPAKMKCVFNGSRLVAYSFLPNCAQATLHAVICGRKFSTVITAHDLCKINGRTLHRLAVKNIFKEHETGILAEDSFDDRLLKDERKSEIISLSIKYSVVSKFTSFIAIEKREKTEDMQVMTGPTMGELLQPAFVDIISEVSWGIEDLTVEENVENLLRKSLQVETSSVLQARQLAEEAKMLYDNVPKRDVVRNLLISARLCELDIAQDKFDPLHDLSEVLLRSDGTLNYDTINTITRSNDSRYIAALRELVRKCWPDHCSVNLASFQLKLQPFVIGAFVAFHNANPNILKSSKYYTTFWEFVIKRKLIPPNLQHEVTDETVHLVANRTGALVEQLNSYRGRSNMESPAKVPVRSGTIGSQQGYVMKRSALKLSKSASPQVMELQSFGLSKIRSRHSLRAAKAKTLMDECAEESALKHHVCSLKPKPSIEVGVPRFNGTSPAFLRIGNQSHDQVSFQQQGILSQSSARPSFSSLPQAKAKLAKTEVCVPKSHSLESDNLQLSSDSYSPISTKQVVANKQDQYFLSRERTIVADRSYGIPNTKASKFFKKLKKKSVPGTKPLPFEEDNLERMDVAPPTPPCSKDIDHVYGTFGEDSFQVDAVPPISPELDMYEDVENSSLADVVKHPISQRSRSRRVVSDLLSGAPESTFELRGGGVPRSATSTLGSDFGTAASGTSGALFGTPTSSISRNLLEPLKNVNFGDGVRNSMFTAAEKTSEESDAFGVRLPGTIPLGLSYIMSESPNVITSDGVFVNVFGSAKKSQPEVQIDSDYLRTGFSFGFGAKSQTEDVVKLTRRSSTKVARDSGERAHMSNRVPPKDKDTFTSSSSHVKSMREKLLETSNELAEEEKLSLNMPRSFRRQKEREKSADREFSTTKENLPTRLVENLEQNVSEKTLPPIQIHQLPYELAGLQVKEAGGWVSSLDSEDDDFRQYSTLGSRQVDGGIRSVPSSESEYESDDDMGFGFFAELPRPCSTLGSRQVDGGIRSVPSSESESDDDMGFGVFSEVADFCCLSVSEQSAESSDGESPSVIVESGERHPIFSLMNGLKLAADQVQANICSRLSASGHWEFHESDLCTTDGSELITLLSLSSKNLIVDSGGKSLGPNCMSAALNMLLTAVFVDILEVLLEHSPSKTSCEFLTSAKNWLIRMDESYPSLYRRLELGSSWQIASRRVINYVCN